MRHHPLQVIISSAALPKQKHLNYVFDAEKGTTTFRELSKVPCAPGSVESVMLFRARDESIPKRVPLVTGKRGQDVIAEYITLVLDFDGFGWVGWGPELERVAEVRAIGFDGRATSAGFDPCRP